MIKIILFCLGFLPIYSFGQQVRPEGIQNVNSVGTFSVSSGVGLVTVNPVITLAALTIVFPPNPNDRDVMVIEYGGTLITGTAVLLLTLSSTVNLLGILPTTAIAGTCMAWMYNATTNKWYRLY